MQGHAINDTQYHTKIFVQKKKISSRRCEDNIQADFTDIL
jgi:hypothetical protein